MKIKPATLAFGDNALITGRVFDCQKNHRKIQNDINGQLDNGVSAESIGNFNY